jgi:hypothetical protein
MDLVLIGVGGALGAMARYIVDGTVSRSLDRLFPWGTFLVNLSGAFALGLFGVVSNGDPADARKERELLAGYRAAYGYRLADLLAQGRVGELSRELSAFFGQHGGSRLAAATAPPRPPGAGLTCPSWRSRRRSVA